MPEAVTSSMIRANDVSFAVTTAGSAGDPFVLVHDGWEDRTAWDAVLPELAGALSVLSYDRRGHGETSGPARQHPGDDDAQDLAELLERSDGYPAHVAALGTAAVVALRTASERPELIRSVLLHEPLVVLLPDDGSGVGPSTAEMIDAVGRARSSVASGRTVDAARAYLAAFGSSQEAWENLSAEAQRRWLRNGPAWAQEVDPTKALEVSRTNLDQIEVPVFVTYGETSPATLRNVADDFVAALPNAQLRDLPRAGHLPHLFAPATLAAVWVALVVERNVPTT